MAIGKRNRLNLLFGLVAPGWHPQPAFRYPWLWMSLAATACMSGLAISGTTAFLEHRGYNLLHQLREQFHPIDWDDRLVVVAIDEASVAKYGRFPWSRDRYTQLLDNLWPVQPAVVSFDILMSESTAQDNQFAQAIADSGNVVLAIASDGQGTTLSLPTTLAEPAQGTFFTGFVNNWPDADGVSRQIRLYEAGSQGDFPSLSLATWEIYHSSLAQTQRGENSPQLAPEIDQSSSRSGNLSRLLGEPKHWLNWPAPVSPTHVFQTPVPSAIDSINATTRDHGSLTVLSFADVVEGTVDLSDLQNKIVLVGATTVGVDPMRNPFHLNPPTSGVYLHAAILDNLLNQRFLKRLPQPYLPLLLLLLSGLTGYLLHNRGVKAQLLYYSGFPLLWLGLVYGAFLMQGWWLPLATPVGVVWLTAAGLQLQGQRERYQLMNLFAMSVAPETAKLIWQRKQEIFDQGELAPQELTATVLFMDIRGFTTISETLSSEALLDWLNEYFETMTDCIMAHGGVVDKYIGDAIMAVFGAPFPRTTSEQIQQDAIAATQAGLEMHQKLTELNQRFRERQLPTISFGIGIHTGKLIAGTVGNRHRISYSMFGDTVNVAARIEGLTKQIPEEAEYRILVSEATQELIQRHFRTQLLCSTALRGRGSETMIHQIEAPVKDWDAAIAPQSPVRIFPALSVMDLNEENEACYSER